MQTPPLLHAVDLQTHVNVGSLYAESVPAHPVQLVEFVHPVQLLLQAKLSYHKFLYNKYFKKVKASQIIFIIPVHVPPLFHAVVLQIHVNAGVLYAESGDLHVVQTVALVHAVQLLLQTKSKQFIRLVENKFTFIQNKTKHKFYIKLILIL